MGSPLPDTSIGPAKRWNRIIPLRQGRLFPHSGACFDGSDQCFPAMEI